MGVRVLTINVWSRSGPWEQRYALLRRQIEALDPDLIGMQEVLSDGHRDLASEIVDGLGYATVFGAAKTLAEGIEFGNAILARPPLTPFRDPLEGGADKTEPAPGEVPSSVAVTIPLPNAGVRDQRCLVGVRVETHHGVLPFWCTHLAFRPHHGFVREAQVVSIARAIRRHRHDGDLAPVLVGDFNARPDATEMRFLRGLHSLEGESCFFIDAFEEVGRGPGYTRDPARNPFGALHHDRSRRIDHIFVGSPDARGRGRVTEAAVALDAVEDGVAGSDHFGVFADIAYGPPS